MDTLALGYVIPAIRAHSGLAPVRQRSCRAYQMRKVRRPQSAHLSKKIVFVMDLRMILSDFASEGKGATGTSRTVLRGFRSPRQIRFRHRRGSRHREILDHRDDSGHRDDSDHREQRDA